MNSKKEDVLLYGLLALLVFSLFHRLDFLHLKFEEPRRALVSLEMIRSGDWLHPSIYGLPYYNKPPIYNWVLALCIKVFGTDNWVIRLPTVLSLLGVCGLNFWFFRKKIGHKEALWSTIFFATSLNIYYYFSFQGEIDMFYTLIVYTQVLVIFYYFEKGDFWRLFLLSYLLTSIGFLTKGMPSIGFQGMTLIGFMLYYKKFRWFFSLQHLIAGSISVLIIASYFIAYDATGGQAEFYLSKIFFEGTRRTVNHNQTFQFLHSFLSFLPLMIYLLSPWLILGVFGVSKEKLREQWGNPWLKQALIFLLFNLPIYWLSAGTRDRYLYMFLPFFMVWIAPWVLSAVDKTPVRKVTSAVMVAVGIAALVLLFTSFASLPNAHIVLISLGLLLIFFGALNYQKRQFSPMLSWLILLVLLRLSFNYLVFEDRKREEVSANFATIIEEIVDLTGGQPIYYHTPTKYEEVSLPLIDQSIYFRSVDRLHYSFTYYLNNASLQTLKYSEELLPKTYVIMPVSELPVGTNQILLEFELGEKSYLLIKA